MIVALLLPFMPVAGWWSYRFQRRASTLVRTRRAPVAAGRAAGPETAPAAASAMAGSPGSQVVQAQPAASTGSRAVQQLERPSAGKACTSVLGWDAFTLAATLVLDGSLLLSCRRSEPSAGAGRAGVKARKTSEARAARTAGEATGASGAGDAGEAGEELTVVLRIGDDARADQAAALFESWRAFGTLLRLRPTTVAGAIEILDEHQRIVRAPLLLA